MTTDKYIKQLLTLMLLTVGFANAQTTADGWVIENIHGPSQVGIVDTIPVDLNKDGLMDVVSVSIEDGHLRAYINQGNLNFEQQYISTEVLGAFRVSATDLNADNQTDFLIPSIETQEIIALIADANAQPYGYRKQIIASGVLLPTDAQAGDFNNDGLMDVVSLSFEENLVLLHSQNISGDFNTTVLSTSPQKPRKLVVEDFNNDQRLDILVASSEDNSVRLFNNDGTGLFFEMIISDQLTGIRSIAMCDLPDADFPDFVAGVTDANQVLLFDNNEGSSFSSKVIDDDLPAADSVSCADIDQDQVLETISISRLFGNIYSQEIAGTPAKQLIANMRDGYITAQVTNLDINSQPLVLTQAYFESRNLVYTPQQSNQEAVIWEEFPDGAYYVESGDVDGDGDEDLVYPAFRENKIYWAEKTISGYVTHTVFDGVDGPQSIKLSDIDQDGDMDIFSAGAWDDSVWFHQQQDSGLFQTFLVTDSANNAARIEVMDVNGDNRLDVIGTSSLDDSLRWYDRNGVKFTETLIDNQVDGALALSVNDLNADGKEDIVVGSFFGNQITLFFNDGSGNFTKQTVSSDKLKPTTILTADVDGDSDLDIVFNASMAGTVWLLEKVGNAFVELLVHDRGTKVTAMALFDFELDGYLDVLDISDKDGGMYQSKSFDNQAFETILIRAERMGARSIVPLSTEEVGFYHFVLASTNDNSIKIITRVDGIFTAGFEQFKF